MHPGNTEPLVMLQQGPGISRVLGVRVIQASISYSPLPPPLLSSESNMLDNITTTLVLPCCRTGNKSQAQVVRLGVRVIQASNLSRCSTSKVLDPFATVKCERDKFVTKAIAKVCEQLLPPPSDLRHCHVRQTN